MIWCIAAAFAAFFVKGLCGFADALIFSSCLSYFYDTRMITPLSLLVCSPTNMIIAIRERRLIQVRKCLPFIIPILLGELPGLWLLGSMDTRMLKVIFGVFVAGLGVWMLIRKGDIKPMSTAAKWIYGIVAGIACGMFSVGIIGVAALQRVFTDPHEAKANIAFVFLFDTAFRVPVYFLTGYADLALLGQAAILWPVMVVSLLLGLAVSKKIGSNAAVTVIRVMLIISGLALAISNL